MQDVSWNFCCSVSYLPIYNCPCFLSFCSHNHWLSSWDLNISKSNYDTLKYRLVKLSTCAQSPISPSATTSPMFLVLNLICNTWDNVEKLNPIFFQPLSWSMSMRRQSLVQSRLGSMWQKNECRTGWNHMFFSPLSSHIRNPRSDLFILTFLMRLQLCRLMCECLLACNQGCYYSCELNE